MHDFIREQVSKAIAKAIEDEWRFALEQARAMEPITTRNIFEHPLTYTPYVEYGFPPREKEDEANVIEGSIVQPVTDEGRLLK
jgi:myosin-crossreactive antigen